MSSCFVTDCVALSEIQTKSGRKSRFEGLAYSIRSRGCASTTSTRWHQMNELPDADFGLLRPDVMWHPTAGVLATFHGQRSGLSSRLFASHAAGVSGSARIGVPLLWRRVPPDSL